MFKLRALLLGTLCMHAAVVTAGDRAPLPQNFATGGATSSDASGLTRADPATAARIVNAGLIPLGLSQQIDLALDTQFGVKSKQDVFALLVGGNDYIFGFATDPAEVVGRIQGSLERLYQSRLGARNFIVFGLIPLGESPLFAGAPDVIQQLDAVAAAHNVLLRAALDAFKAQHPDALVAFVDSAAVYAGFAGTFAHPSPEFCTSPDPLAFTHPAPATLPPGGCNGFVFMDGLHLTSSAMSFTAAAAKQAWEAAGGEKAQVRSLLSFGDSFLDTGLLANTILRANILAGLGALTAPTGPAYFMNRFSDSGRLAGVDRGNLIDQLESVLPVKTRSSFFAQPIRGVLTLASTGNGALTGRSLEPPASSTVAPEPMSVFVPGSIAHASESRGGTLVLELGDVRCKYMDSRRGPKEYRFSSCRGGSKPGDRVEVAGKADVAADVSDSTQAVLAVFLNYY